MTKREAASITFLAHATFAYKYDFAVAGFDFPRHKAAEVAKFLGLEMGEVNQVAAKMQAGCDRAAWTEEFTAAILPLCVLF